jgi:hypothetical protein
MKDEDLEVLVTLDDPEYGPEEDIFDHRHGGHTLKSGLVDQQEGEATMEQKS